MINRAELLNKISASYNLPNLKLNGKSRYGVSNLSYYATSNNVKYLVKIYSNNKLDKIHKLDYLYNLSPKLNVFVPQITYPMKSKDNKNYVQVNEEIYIFIYKIINGVHMSNLNKKQITSLSLALKDFNNIARLIGDKSLFNHNKKFEYLDNKDIEVLVQKFSVSKNLYSDILYFLNNYNFKSNNTALLHDDTDFTNYLFKENDLVAILDLDDVRLGDQREEIIKTTLGISFLRDDLTFSVDKANQFITTFKNNDIDKDLIDYIIFRHIFSSQKTFIRKSKINDIILNYFNDLFYSFQKDKNVIYKAFGL